MDQERTTALADNTTHLDAMTQIVINILADNLLAVKIDAGGNFMLLTILQGKWLWGPKSKFKIMADRVKANHTYLAHIFVAAKLNKLDDKDSLKQESTQQSSLSLAFYIANRRRFANVRFKG